MLDPFSFMRWLVFFATSIGGLVYLAHFARAVRYVWRKNHESIIDFLSASMPAGQWPAFLCILALSLTAGLAIRYAHSHEPLLTWIMGKKRTQAGDVPFAPIFITGICASAIMFVIVAMAS